MDKIVLVVEIDPDNLLVSDTIQRISSISDNKSAFNYLAKSYLENIGDVSSIEIYPSNLTRILQANKSMIMSHLTELAAPGDIQEIRDYRGYFFSPSTNQVYSTRISRIPKKLMRYNTSTYMRYGSNFQNSRHYWKLHGRKVYDVTILARINIPVEAA